MLTFRADESGQKSEGGVWGYQLWLSLPARDKMVEPRYQHLSPDMIPSVKKGSMNVKISRVSMKVRTAQQKLAGG
jgi:redox-sensitive bicupin YhaK (pirin superfamily)